MIFAINFIFHVQRKLQILVRRLLGTILKKLMMIIFLCQAQIIELFLQRIKVPSMITLSFAM